MKRNAVVKAAGNAVLKPAGTAVSKAALAKPLAGAAHTDEPVRPSVWQWLRYAWGSGLPPAQRTWVLRDVTGRGWVLRHLARASVQILPLLILVGLFLPGPAMVIIPTCVGGAAIGYIYSVAYMIESTDYRLTKAGYPSGLAEQTREARAHAQQQATAQKHRDRMSRAATRRSR
jgi:hypothetical protein